MRAESTWRASPSRTGPASTSRAAATVSALILRAPRPAQHSHAAAAGGRLCSIVLGDVESGALRLQLLRRVAQDRGRVLRVQESHLSMPDQRARPPLRSSMLSAHTDAKLPCSAYRRGSAGYETSELASMTAMNNLCSAALSRAPCEACADAARRLEKRFARRDWDGDGAPRVGCHGGPPS